MPFLKASLMIQVSLLFLWGCDSSRFTEFSGATMGTSYHITAKLASDQKKEDLQSAFVRRLEEIEESMSTYRPSSEISRFNQAGLDAHVPVSQDFVRVLQVSKGVYQKTSGAFDPGVGALVELWGFGRKLSLDQFQSIPGPDAIAYAKSLLGFAYVLQQDSTIYKTAPVQLDFSAVAKGYAVDELARLLADQGVTDYMVEIGGEIATRGKSPRGGKWRIGIEAPNELKGSVVTALALGEAYLATSGDYRNYYEVDGVRYSHTIDPRTGYPIKHKLSSVTVIATSTADADAWATALMVLGEDEGYQLAEKLALPSYFIYREGETFKIKFTEPMRKFFGSAEK